MSRQPLFAGLVVDEQDQPVETTYVGDEPMYVVNDQGFRRHIPSEQVDRQVLNLMRDQLRGNEDIIGEQAAKMLGQEDLFSRAIIQNQIKNIDKQLDQILETGIPESGRAYMGMMGFRVVINVHGEVVRVNQPGMIDDEGDE
jgi:predicted  nucleic acid-binding Zn ribbon protein